MTATPRDPGGGLEGRQPEASDEQRTALSRYSPVTAAAYTRLPESSARSFAVASALGRIIGPAGSSAPIRSGKDATGVVIRGKQRQRIIADLGISDRRWRQLVADWERRYVAHHCSRDAVCLFVVPHQNPCPACGAAIEHLHTAPRPDARRNSPRSRETEASLPLEAEASLPSLRKYVLPQEGTNASAGEEPTLPLLVADSAHPFPGSASRGDVRSVGDSAVALASGSGLRTEGHQEEEGSQDRAPAAEIADDSDWPPVSKACSECGAWPHQGVHFAGCSSFVKRVYTPRPPPSGARIRRIGGGA